MRFKAFEQVSFTLSERTAYDALIARGSPWSHRHDEVVVFLSRGEDQIIFVTHYVSLGDGSKVLSSRRLRLDKGTWDIFKLKKYADMAGLQVTDWTLLTRAMAKAKREMVQSVKERKAA